MRCSQQASRQQPTLQPKAACGKAPGEEPTNRPARPGPAVQDFPTLASSSCRRQAPVHGPPRRRPDTTAVEQLPQVGCRDARNSSMPLFNRVTVNYPNPNPIFLLPEFLGTRKNWVEFGFDCSIPEFFKTRKTRPEFSGIPECPVLAPGSSALPYGPARQARHWCR